MSQLSRASLVLTKTRPNHSWLGIWFFAWSYRHLQQNTGWLSNPTDALTTSCRNEKLLQPVNSTGMQRRQTCAHSGRSTATFHPRHAHSEAPERGQAAGIHRGRIADLKRCMLSCTVVSQVGKIGRVECRKAQPIWQAVPPHQSLQLLLIPWHLRMEAGVCLKAVPTTVRPW